MAGFWFSFNIATLMVLAVAVSEVAGAQAVVIPITLYRYETADEAQIVLESNDRDSLRSAKVLLNSDPAVPIPVQFTRDEISILKRYYEGDFTYALFSGKPLPSGIEILGSVNGLILRLAPFNRALRFDVGAQHWNLLTGRYESIRAELPADNEMVNGRITNAQRFSGRLAVLQPAIYYEHDLDGIRETRIMPIVELSRSRLNEGTSIEGTSITRFVLKRDFRRLMDGRHRRAIQVYEVPTAAIVQHALRHDWYKHEMQSYPVGVVEQFVLGQLELGSVELSSAHFDLDEAHLIDALKKNSLLASPFKFGWEKLAELTRRMEGAKKPDVLVPLVDDLPAPWDLRRKIDAFNRLIVKKPLTQITADEYLKILGRRNPFFRVTQIRFIEKTLPRVRFLADVSVETYLTLLNYTLSDGVLTSRIKANGLEFTDNFDQFLELLKYRGPNDDVELRETAEQTAEEHLELLAAFAGSDPSRYAKFIAAVCYHPSCHLRLRQFTLRYISFGDVAEFLKFWSARVPQYWEEMSPSEASNLSDWWREQQQKYETEDADSQLLSLERRTQSRSGKGENIRSQSPGDAYASAIGNLIEEKLDAILLLDPSLDETIKLLSMAKYRSDATFQLLEAGLAKVQNAEDFVRLSEASARNSSLEIRNFVLKNLDVFFGYPFAKAQLSRLLIVVSADYATYCKCLTRALSGARNPQEFISRASVVSRFLTPSHADEMLLIYHGQTVASLLGTFFRFKPSAWQVNQLLFAVQGLPKAGFREVYLETLKCAGQELPAKLRRWVWIPPEFAENKQGLPEDFRPKWPNLIQNGLHLCAQAFAAYRVN